MTYETYANRPGAYARGLGADVNVTLVAADYGPPATPGGKPLARPGSVILLVIAPQG